VEGFNTEQGYDKLSLSNGMQYQGTSGPDGVRVNFGDTMTWSSDDTWSSDGFSICLEAEGDGDGDGDTSDYGSGYGYGYGLGDPSTEAPTAPTAAPTLAPTAPTAAPTLAPTLAPTGAPSIEMRGNSHNPSLSCNMQHVSALH